jgi:hypothetical protein
MPNAAQDVKLQRFERLIEAVRKHEASLPGIMPFRDALERSYSRALFYRRRKDVARAAAREATRQCEESISAAYDAATAVSNFLKGLLGHRSAALREFGLQPTQKRRRRKPDIDYEQPS